MAPNGGKTGLLLKALGMADALRGPTTSICLELPRGTNSGHVHIKSSRLVFLKPRCTLTNALESKCYEWELLAHRRSRKKMLHRFWDGGSRGGQECKKKDLRSLFSPGSRSEHALVRIPSHHATLQAGRVTRKNAPFGTISHGEISHGE